MSDDQLGELAGAIVEFCRVRLPFEGGQWLWWKVPVQLRAAATTRPRARDLEDRYRTATGVTARRAVGDVEYTIRLVSAAVVAGVDQERLRAGCRTLLSLFAANKDADKRLAAIEAAFDAARRPTDQFPLAWHELGGPGRT